MSFPFSGRKRSIRILALVLATGLFAGAVLWIPLGYPSMTLQYLFGRERGMLLAGQVLGMALGGMLALQVILASRIPALDRLFGLDRLVLWHGWNGRLLAWLVFVHPLLVFEFAEYPLLFSDSGFWPELAGLVLLVLVVGLALGGCYRKRMNLPFHIWMPLHLAAGILAVIGFGLHLLFSGDTFEVGIPRWGALGLCGALGGLLLFRHLPFFRPTSDWRVATIRPVSPRAVELVLVPCAGVPFDFLPGQFAFLSFRSASVSREAHPFTIASSPELAHRIFVIGTSGDWTRTLEQVQEGDAVRVEGPYGRFSHLLTPAESPLLLIAGGIGITPMLAMLRHLQDTGGQRPVRLVWSAKGEDAFFCRAELADMADLDVRFVDTAGPEGRIDRGLLAESLAGFSDPDVFLCGPPPMMAAVARLLREEGIPGHGIHTEVFGF